jgi:hypothetical protein
MFVERGIEQRLEMAADDLLEVAGVEQRRQLIGQVSCTAVPREPSDLAAQSISTARDAVKRDATGSRRAWRRASFR